MRNVGSAIGISIAITLLSHSTFVVYQQMGESVTALNPLFHNGAAGMFFNPSMPMGLTAVHAELLREAQIVAYRNDFIFMLVVSLPTALLLLLMKRPKQAHAESIGQSAAALE
jgi:DHA2 family multidrug resistance protein